MATRLTKYRAYLPVIDEIRDVVSIKFIEDTHIEVEIKGGDGAVFHLHTDYLMQFTGIEDINGVEIYERDLVKKDKVVYEVVFSKKAAKFCIRKLKRGYCRNDQKKVYSILGTEVVGNAFDNYAKKGGK